MIVNTSPLVQSKKGNNIHSSKQRSKYVQPTISSAVDNLRGEGPIGGKWRTTEINSTISGKEGPVKLNNPLLIAGFPGPGLIGSISTSFIIESLGCDR